MLNRSKSGSYYLVPDLREKTFHFSLFNIKLTVSLSYMAFIAFRNVPSIPSFLRPFYHGKMFNFIQCFFITNWKDYMFVCFGSGDVRNHNFCLIYVESSLHSWNEWHLIMVNDLFLMCCLIWLVVFYWKFLHLCLSEILACSVCCCCCCCVFIWFWHYSNTGLAIIYLEVFRSLLILGDSLTRIGIQQWSHLVLGFSLIRDFRLLL